MSTEVIGPMTISVKLAVMDAEGNETWLDFDMYGEEAVPEGAQLMVFDCRDGSHVAVSTIDEAFAQCKKIHDHYLPSIMLAQPEGGAVNTFGTPQIKKVIADGA